MIFERNRQRVKNLFKRGTAAAFAVTISLGLGTAFVSAQNNSQAGNGFRISPVRSEYIIEKGRSETMVVTLENPTAGPINAEAVVNNFVASDKEDGEPRLILDDSAQQPSNNFKSLIGQLPDVSLKPGEKREIPVTITIPREANSGGYYGAVRFVPSESGGNGNVALTASVGSIVLVRVPGNLTEKLNLVQLSAAQEGKTKSFITGGDVGVVTRLRNTGNIHVQPFGKVQIKSMFGKIIAEYELNSTDPRANILPDSIRRFEDGIKKPKPFWFGRYTITANIGYSQGSGDLISTSASFWYLPTWFLVLLLLIIIAIVGAVFWLRSGRGSGGGGRRHSKRIRKY
jgi:hypothetical protein